MRYILDETAVTNFSMATNRSWTDHATGQKVSETTWFRVSVWRHQAEAANQYLSKGSKVIIEGRLRPDPATGGPRTYPRHDGTVGASYEITADMVQFLPSANDPSIHALATGTAVEDEDDIPF